MATAAEISEYDTEELERQLGETRRELFNLRFQLATGQLDNVSRMNHVRKDVARMLTELRNREIAEAEGLSLDQLPAHKAAARRRDEDEAKGRELREHLLREHGPELVRGPGHHAEHLSVLLDPEPRRGPVRVRQHLAPLEAVRLLQVVGRHLPAEEGEAVEDVALDLRVEDQLLA